MKLILGFVPWIVYLLVVTVAGPRGVAAAAVLALAVALVLVGRSLLARQPPKLLAVAAAVIFAAYTVVALLAPATDAFLAAYGRALAAVLLALTILALLPVLPFTEQFARESVPRRYWSSPRFRSVNRRVSAVWAAAIGGSGFANALAVVVLSEHEAHRGLLPLLLRIGVPVVLFLAAMRCTRRVAGGHSADRAQAADHRPV